MKGMTAGTKHGISRKEDTETTALIKAGLLPEGDRSVDEILPKKVWEEKRIEKDGTVIIRRRK